ncbi:MAG TPA: SDR family NAD(P)-dependent oxidoreductase, partial [Baekduia sp.]|nr:SDR family NAD(P)-dependent oxidoreductase [Baekduia sp.]
GRSNGPVYLGSLKSNIGHTQAAAGVGGVIKMVQAMRHQRLPKTLWAQEPSPHVDWDAGELQVLNEPVDWPAGERVRRAGISSFGMSGTNAHVVIEAAPATEEAVARPIDSRVLPFLVSASSEGGLAAQAQRLGEHVAAHPELDAAAVAGSLALGRAGLAHRAVALVGGLEELAGSLGAFAQGAFVESLVQGVARDRRVGFVFPGQGGQWEGMAVALWDASPVFAGHMRACGEALSEFVDWSLEDVLRGAPGAPSLERVDVVQPALFAVMVSLARLWESFGVRPAAVVGHSQGEIPAAHIAGALSLQDAARVVAVRSKVLSEMLSGLGGMVAVGIGAERAETYLEPCDGRVSLAAVNSPSSVVVSGELAGLHDLIARCEADGVPAKLLPVDYAAHSAQIEVMRERLLEEFAPVRPQAGDVPLYSTVTGERLDTSVMDAEYWYRNLRQTVRFDEAVRAMVDDGTSAVVEAGPHPVLSTQVVESIEAAGHDADAVPVIASLHRADGGLERFIRSLAEAHVTGIDIDWGRLLDRTAGVPLPTYAFQRSRYWLTSSTEARDPSALGQAPAQHPLLDATITLAAGQGTLFTGRLSLERFPWLADHVVMGQVLLPATAFLDLALHLGAQADAPVLDELTLSAPLALGAGQTVALQATVTEADDDGRRQLSVHSRTDGPDAATTGWTQHAAATLAPDGPGDRAELQRLATMSWPPADGQVLGGDQLYDTLADAGYEYGPAFQGLSGAWRRRDRIDAQAALVESQEQHASTYGLHPALLDAVLQAAVLGEIDAGGAQLPVAPFSFTGVRLHAKHASQARASLVKHEAGTRLAVLDGSGAPVLSIEAFTTRPLDRRQLRTAQAGGSDAMHAVRWEELAAPAGDAAALHIVALGDDETLAALAGERYAGLDALSDALGGGAAAPDVVLVDVAGDDTEPVAAIHALTERTLETLKAWLASEPLAAARLLLVTRGAVAVDGREAPDLAQAAAAGLVRSAHSEHPDRFMVLDVDGSEPPLPALVAALADQEALVALRDGALFVPRLAHFTPDPAAVPRVGGDPWRLALGTPGSLDGIGFADSAEAQRPLGPGEVRIAVHAAGLNFKDVVVALGLVGDADTTIGLEGSGVVLETGADVTDLAPGDRVMGLIADAFGPVAITDRRLVVKVPQGWTHVQAASVPVVFLTAYHALVQLADVQAGEALLVHGAAGGVGMAALQIARHLGAEVYATAHPGKWGTLRALGVDEAHLASSRSAEFRETFLQATGGRGVDVVLDSLAGDMVDASLQLLPRGGRFIELGKADVRDPEQVAAGHPGVRYQAFDLLRDVGPERIQELLAELVALLERGALQHLPVAAYDVRQAAEAFRVLRESRHTGKLVLRVPQPLDPDHTVLITGGTGGLGAMLARHLAERHGARRLLLVSRSGPAADGADALVASLEALGCEATVAACDVSDRAQLEALLAGVPTEHPLTAVVHLAGAFDDGVVAALDAGRLRTVMRPKVDPAIHLHELTRDLDLAEFILYSSVAATFGLPGQGNYAAANAVLDALAQRRRVEGLPGVSLGLGVWQTATALTRRLTDDDGVLTGAAGMLALPDEEGLELVDEARALDQPLLLPVTLDRARLRSQARAGVLAPIMRGLFGSPARTAAASGGAFAAKLAAAPEGQRQAIALELTREHLAAVLGHGDAQQIDEQRTFKELGINSLSGVELRNRIAKAAGLTLPATLVFDYPTPAAVAALLCDRVEDREVVAGVVAAAPRAEDDPIVIVGIGCRFPGGVRSAEDLWELVAAGRDVIGDFPTDRGWNLERLFDPDPDRPGTSRTRHGGFLDDAAEFDAEHFSISPREALTMDPQQRVLLECAWEALEDAGIDPLGLRGSRTGVFAGVFESGYVSTNDAPELEGFRVLGGVNAAISGRLSYVLGLEGAAVSVDTACSSSLVALHLAAQALRAGECDLVLAGGVSVVANPDLFSEFSRQGALSPDGRCRAFGAEANGTGFSEGAGVLVLERLSDAVRHGHEVLAVVRGSATNQDGASNGMSAPNGPSQERVIRAALANAGLAPSEVDAVEAHGTGTTLGDPIEAQALLATYGQDRMGGPMYLGSLKSNIGHPQAAAGVAGVIKMVMALRHELLPQTLYVEQPSPHVDWDSGDIELLAEPHAWPAGDRVRRAAVSAFGLSGTNAHVVLEEPPVLERPGGDADGGRDDGAGAVDSRVLPFLVSASSESGLVAQAQRLGEHVAARPELDAAVVAGSLALGRARLAHRAVAVVGGVEELAESLSGFARGELVESLVQGVARRDRRVGFVFPGQGGQWEGMAVALWDASPVFAGHMRACGEALSEFVDWSLEDVLRGAPGASSLDRVDVVQPALFAVMVSLARLWESFGVEPAAVVGHSQGEIAAAHVAGALSLRDAARVVAVRSAVLSEMLSGLGGMVAVGAGAERVVAYLERYGGRVSLAAVNSPSSVVVSGELAGLHDLIARCEADGVPAKLLPVDYAAHSAQIEVMRERLLEEFAPVSPQAADVPLYSTVTGERMDTAVMDAEYWYRNLRQTVRFDEAVRAMVGDGIGAVVEAGPHPVLGTAVVETVEAAGHDADAVAVVGSLRRSDGGLERFIRSLAEAHVTGIDVDWGRLLDGTARVPLPTYAFQRRRYWLAPSGRTRDPSALGLGSAQHPLLDAAITLAADQGTVLTGRLSLERFPWLADHALLGQVLLPGTGFLDLALHAGAQTDAPVIEELTLSAPLLLNAGETLALQLTVTAPDEDGRRQLTIHSCPDGAGGSDITDWTLHATGTLFAEQDAGERPDVTLPSDAATEHDVDDAYDRLARAGYDYGPAFQALRQVAIDGDQVSAEVALDDTPAADAAAHRIHPALADAVLQALALSGLDAQETGRPVVPFSFGGVRLHRAGASSAHAYLEQRDGTWRITVVDDTEAPVLTIDAVATRTIDARNLLTTAQPARDALWEVQWSPLAAMPQEGEAPVLAALGDDPAIAALGPAVEPYPDLEALEDALDDAAPVPDRGVVGVGRPGAADELLGTVHDITERTLGLLKAWLASERLAASKLVVVTRSALAVDATDTPNLSHATLPGLLRSANAEHPGRFMLIDIDDTEASLAAIGDALRSDEPEVAIRAGAPRVARLVRASVEQPAPEPPPLRTGGTILITGGTSGLGALTARHLAERHGARRLLLASRRGPEAPGADELRAALAQLGCEVEIVACDVSQRPEVERLLAAIPADRPLAAVVHAAGTLDDGVLEALDGERLRRVLAPKLDAAVHLHELTRDLEPAEFVLFSSAAATLGSPGQANYAAANAFLDALAHARRAEGLPALSLALGFWERTTELTQHLTTGDGRRAGPLDLLPISDELGLQLIDTARGADRALLAPIRLDLAGLRARAAAGVLPSILSGLVPAGSPRAAARGGSLARTLAAAPEADRDRVAGDFVRGHLAAVLGHASPEGIDLGRPFKELGIDSLSAVGLRNRLAKTSGLTLPATLVFDHPTPAAVATLLRGMVEGRSREVATRPARRARVDEPIAIVGMACRFPGGVASAEDLWDLVASGRDAISEFPTDRGWDVQRLFDPAGDRPGTISARHGGFLTDAADFDAAHFGISPREALAMDPQQRLLLECSWEALEDAGIDPLGLHGSGTGVFVGAFDSNYGTGNNVPELEGYRMLGVTTSAGAGRVSYVLGLEGPAVSVDTACSSSLVAVHLASQALRGGECDLALAGGVTLMATTELFVELSRQRGLSPDGRCRAFGAGANGAGFSDGVGVLVLERLSVARERGHRVLAVVRGSAVNQDGASNGFSAPNGPSQERVIRAALASAGLTPDDVDAVEAHGTGTTLGDPIEAQALLATYGQGRS